MAKQTLTGNRLRCLRSEHGLTQVALAKRLNISASYLNLIEHNQRPLTRPLIGKLSRDFGVDPQALTGHQEVHLLADLSEIFSDQVFHGSAPRRQELEELVGRAPALCGAILKLYQAFRNAREEIQSTNERLAEDPFLSSASHQLLTVLTTMRSFSEILQDNAELAEFKRQEFAGILVEESQKLTGLVKGLFEFLSGDARSALRSAELPGDEVNDALQIKNNYFAELEEIAEALRSAASGPECDGMQMPRDLADSLERLVRQEYGITCQESVAPRDGQARVPYFDADTRILTLPAAAPLRLRIGRLARLAVRHGYRDALRQLVENAGLSSAEAGRHFESALLDYVMRAVLMPYGEFHAEARRCRHDLDWLAERFAVTRAQVAQRLVTLQRPGEEGLPFHFVAVDIAGNVSRRFTASGLPLPRYGGICPRWNLHTAFMSPDTIDVQVARMPDDTTYLFLSGASCERGDGYGKERDYRAFGLGCEVAYSRQLIYADGLNLESDALATPVGPNCRLCERDDCRQRAHPSLLRQALLR